MSKPENMIVETEWSYFYDVNTMNDTRVAFTIAPDKEAARRLALRLGLESLDSLKADIVIQKRSKDIAYHVTGKIVADITQACVVTLEPVHNTIKDSFEAWYSDPEGPVSFAKMKHERESIKAHGEMPMLEEKDDPEPLIQGKIDLGELVTQHLSLSIDPYPHADGVEFHANMDPKMPEGPDLVKNPFAALKEWKDKLDKDEN